MSIIDRVQSICQRASGTCNYYKDCLEPQFPCGQKGFVLQYAKHHCEAVGKLELSSSTLWDWLHEVNDCIQDGLRDLIDGEFKEVVADKVTCLSYERRAIEKINACYRQPYGDNSSNRPQLCQVLGNHITQPIRQDLKNIISALNMGDHYHNSTVDSGIPELVRECGHPDVADSLYVGKPTYRLVFCTWITVISAPGNDNLNQVDEMLKFLSHNLSDDQSNFQYGGPDRTDSCQNTPHSSHPHTNYHIVTWFASSNNTAARNWNKTNTAIIRDQGKFYPGFFELMNKTRVETEYGTIRDSTKCGDGIRQSGELCDYAMVNSPACSFDCQIRQVLNESRYECSVGRLNRSYCWIQQCGDGRRTSNEECDDGNAINGDGCDRFCQIEPHFRCISNYNSTSHCIYSSSTTAQHLQTRSNAKEHSESQPQIDVFISSPLEASSASSLNSRTVVLLMTIVIATLWTALILA